VSRRRRHEEPENHERWLVSYADFITLLFAFFVVMYAVSSVNEGKYRVLSDAMVSAFRSSNRSLEPIQVGQLVRSPQVRQELPVNTPRPIAMPVQAPQAQDGKGGALQTGEAQSGEGPERNVGQEGQDPGARPADREAVAQRIEKALGDLIERGLVDVRTGENGVEVEIKTSLLFPSGSAKLVDTALPVLRNLSEVLRAFPNPIQVQGFTDNVPINTEVFPSNWELSAGRAASVVHVYTRNGVRPDRMVAIGYGEHRPVADNATQEGRSRNRRVVVVISAAPRAREWVDNPADARGLPISPLPYSPVPVPVGEELLLRPGNR
jgi:chemotaxis protein MotB